MMVATKKRKTGAGEEDHGGDDNSDANDDSEEIDDYSNVNAPMMLVYTV